MQKIANLFLIGGNGRNIGKTTFACMLIEKLSMKKQVVGVKISNIKPDDRNFHGFHEKSLEGEFEIFEESGPGDKDSHRMLAAEATRSFFIRTSDSFVEDAFFSLMKQFDEHSYIVCESNSLRKYTEPKAFIMVGNKEIHDKTGTMENFKIADFIVKPMDLEGFGELVKMLD